MIRRLLNIAPGVNPESSAPRTLKLTKERHRCVQSRKYILDFAMVVLPLLRSCFNIPSRPRVDTRGYNRWPFQGRIGLVNIRALDENNSLWLRWIWVRLQSTSFGAIKICAGGCDAVDRCKDKQAGDSYFFPAPLAFLLSFLCNYGVDCGPRQEPAVEQ
jgi:hypothetical protein